MGWLQDKMMGYQQQHYGQQLRYNQGAPQPEGELAPGSEDDSDYQPKPHQPGSGYDWVNNLRKIYGYR